MKYSWTSIKRPQAPGQSINQSTLFNEFNTGQYFNWITSGPQTKIIKASFFDHCGFPLNSQSFGRLFEVGANLGLGA